MNGKSGSQGAWLLCRAGPHLCALPLALVLEVMRPLPVEPMVGCPAFLRGLSVIRGVKVVVMNLGHLLGHAKPAPTRLITVRAGGHILGLAVTEIIAVRRADEIGSDSAVPLLGEIAQDCAASIGALESELLLLLAELRVLADSVTP